MQTSDDNIYAGGDCVESVHQLTGKELYLPLGSLANRHGRVIAENLAGNDAEFPGVLGAVLLKVFDLNIGAVGLTESVAHEAGLAVNRVWGSFPDKPDYYPEVKTLSAKMVYSENDGKLLGLQAVGNGDVCRRIDVFSVMLQHKDSLDDLLDLEHGYAPPYSEALDPLHHLASAAQAQTRAVDFISPVFDHSRHEELHKDVFWLDVREEAEVSTQPWPCPGGNIVNIPLNDLRRRTSELDRNKRILIVCRRGVRSYQAALILKRAGFEDVHIVGGGTQAALS
jgi:rhodanese-related sulfurtransferase